MKRIILIIWILIFASTLFAAEKRVSYFAIPESESLAPIAGEIEYIMKKALEKRMYAPAEITTREIAVLEDEMNRLSTESHSLIAQGKKLYEELNLDQSFFVFQKIVNNLEGGTAVFEKSTDYQLALMYLGNIYKLKGDETSAKNIFLKLLSYNKKYTPDANYFPPDIIDTFEGVRNEFKTIQKGTLQVVPKPEDAQVFINGVFVGCGKLKVDEINSGEHLIGIKKRGYVPYVRKVVIQRGLVEVVNVELIGYKEALDRYSEIGRLKNSDISTALPTPLMEYRKATGADTSVVIFVTGSPNNLTLYGYTYYKDRLVLYDEFPIIIKTDESRKKILKGSIENILSKILPEDISRLKPVEKISYKKFYTSWWFYSVIGVALIGIGAVGYFLLSPEEKERETGSLIITF